MPPTGRALVIIAHADDAEFLAGGTIAAWTDAGWHVDYLVCTAGDGGTADPTLTAAALMAARQAEQRAAADLLGVADVTFLPHSDGFLEHTLDLRRDIVRAIRRTRPDRAICFDPQPRWFPDYVNHRDHYVCGEAALAALFPAARERLHFPELIAEGLEPHKTMEIWLIGTLQPNHFVDISPTLERKIAAMWAHASQVGDGAQAADTLIRRAADAGSQADPPLAAAESFRLIQMRR